MANYKRVKHEDKPFFDKLIDALGKSLKINGRRVCISYRGFFYESNKHSITWEFEAERIIKMKSDKMETRLKSLSECIPRFRQPYLNGHSWGMESPWGDWLLIKKLNKLKTPIKGQSVNGGYSFPDFQYFSNPKGKLVDLASSHLRGGNAFVLECPKVLELVEPNPEREISEYLKQFLTDNPPSGKLRETNIHDAFLLKLLEEGYIIENEGPVSSGRYDVLFEDKKGNLLAVELKLRRGDNAVNQLKSYIADLKKTYETEIQGVIICGHASEELQKAAAKYGFKVIEYRLMIDIPLTELI
ncbi:MAG: endonuclease NucS domain-containing protein [Nitrososphaerales archaeon]